MSRDLNVSTEACLNNNPPTSTAASTTRHISYKKKISWHVSLHVTMTNTAAAHNIMTNYEVIKLIQDMWNKLQLPYTCESFTCARFNYPCPNYVNIKCL